MQDTTAEGAIQELTSSIIDANQKPYLRSTLHNALSNMGFERQEVDNALDAFFQGRSLQ